MGSQPINYSDTTPAAETGYQNAKWQADALSAPNVIRNVSVEVPIATATVAGLVPTPPNDGTKFLAGDMTYKSLTATLAGDTDVAITTPADGDLLMYSASAGKWKNKQLGAGSNVTITDSSGIEVVAASGGGGGGGGGGSPLFPCQPTIVPPSPIASWTKYDSGSTGVFTDVTDAVSISSTAGNAWKFLYTAAPGAPFTLTAAFFYNMEAGSAGHYPQACVFVGSSSAFRPFGVISGSSAAPSGLWVGGWTSFTSQSSDAKAPFQWNTPQLVWVRVQYDGTNLSFWVSSDGVNWIQLYTEVCSSGILGGAPVNLGFGVSNYNSSLASQMTLVHWNVTTP